ncbi:MAG: PQQ-binding-like beta-propeller repeat protein, partial [Thermoplasmata archaeon]
MGTPDSTIGTAAGSWPTLGFNSQRTGANPLESVVNLSNVSQLAPLWTFHTSGGVTDSLAVVNGTAYFGSWNGTLFAVNTSTGAQEWETDLGGAYDYTGCDSPGITSTPTVWNNTVYVGGSNPWEYALNASTGTILWHVDLANLTGSSSPWTAYKTWSSALVVNGSLYVGTASGCDDPLVRAALLQIDLSNHSTEHISYVVPAGDIGDSIWSSPSFDAASNTVWATTGNGETDLETYARAIVAFNASNASDVVGYAQEAEPGHDYDFGDGVTIFHNSQGVPMVVALNKNGFAYAFNLSTFQGNVSADPAWTLQVTTDPGSSYSPPAFDGHLLYFGSAETTLPNSTAANGSVRAVYPGNGTTKWLVEVPYSVFGGLTYA